MTRNEGREGPVPAVTQEPPKGHEDDSLHYGPFHTPFLSSWPRRDALRAVPREGTGKEGRDTTSEASPSRVISSGRDGGGMARTPRIHPAYRSYFLGSYRPAGVATRNRKIYNKWILHVMDFLGLFNFQSHVTSVKSTYYLHSL